MTQEITLLVVAGAVGAGLFLLAVAVFSTAKALGKLPLLLDEFKSIHHMTREEGLRLEEKRLELEQRRLELESAEKKPYVVLIKSANLKLFEEKQELSVGYSVENLGGGRVLLTKLQVALVNKRTPNLIKIVDMIFNQVVDHDKPFVHEVLVTVKDFTRISLPFVPDFAFIKDSCEIVASLEYMDAGGQMHRIDKDILEW